MSDQNQNNEVVETVQSPPPQPQESNFKKNLRAFTQDLMLGGSAGAISKTLCAPLERVKLLIQTSGDNPALKKRPYKGMGDCFMRCVKEEGVPSLWRGNMSNVVRYFPTTAIGFGTKELYKKAIVRHKKDTNYMMWFVEYLAAGGLAGATSLTFIYPLDFTRTRLAADVGATAKERQFNGLNDCISQIYNKNGLPGLYQGFGISLAGIFVYRAFYFGLYDISQEFQGEDVGFFKQLAMAQAVVTFSELITYPIDTIRRRMMMQADLPKKKWLYKSSPDAFRKIVAQEGGAALFQGAYSNFVRSIASALVLVMYGRMKKALGLKGGAH